MSRHAEHPARRVDEHRGAVIRALRGLAPRAAETVPLREALGRVLAADLCAPLSLQPFDNSQMDGFAVRAADTRAATGAVELVVVAAVPAGHVPDALAAGQAAPVMTGAPLPAGADAVVPVEEASPSAFPAPGSLVRLPADQPPGRFVRRAGEDVVEGELALRAGQRLTPARIGLAAALGCAELAVRARPRAVVYTTGDEVVAPGAERGPAQIYDANAAILCAQLAEAGIEVVGAHLVPDDAGAFASRLVHDAPGADLFVSSGGVSEGAYEVVRQVLEPHGHFGHVTVQPGGPQGLARVHGVPFVCLPGNPVSTFVSFEMFLRPALTEVVGAPAPRPRLRAPLGQAVRPLPGRTQVRRAVWDGTAVQPAGGAGSHLLASAARANALALLPPGDTELPAGTPVELLLLD